MKRYVSLLLAIIFCLPLFGCGKKQGSDTTETTAETAPKAIIGVSLAGGDGEATLALARQFVWELTEAGYIPAVQRADRDTATQIRQIEEMVALGAEAIIVQAADCLSLTETADTLKSKNIPLVACDCLLMNTDALFGCVSYDYVAIGERVAREIVSAKNLDKAKDVTIEFFMGTPEDYNSLLFHQGVMNILKPYLDSGALVCKSGQLTFEDSYTPEDEAQAKTLCALRLKDTYTSQTPLQICLAATDTVANGCRKALEKAGFTRKNWPLITSVGGSEKAAQAVADGYQLLTVKKDPAALVTASVETALTAIAGNPFPAETTLNNYTTDVPVLFLDTQMLDS